MPVRTRSIRWHIMLMVFGGAILPMAFIAIWLTRTAMGSGKALLREELELSTASISNTIRGRWLFRRGQLALLASNTVAIKALSKEQLTDTDSQYLAQQHERLAQVIPVFAYRDMAGNAVWSSGEPSTESEAAEQSADGRAARAALPPSFHVRLPVNSADGAILGHLDASVSLYELVPADSTRLPVPGAIVAFRDRAASGLILPVTPRAAISDTGEVMILGSPWLAVRSQLDDPALEIIVAAPAARYVDPFLRAGRSGLFALGIVAVLALLLTAYLTTIITAPLQRLAAASTAVAEGDIQETVTEAGPTEIRTLARSFNTMTASLRRTLDELSQRSALAAVGEFAASLAHEVRNGLTSVKVDLQRAEEKQEPGSAGQDLVSRSLATVTQLNSTVSGALQVARSGTMAARPVDLRAVLANAEQRTTFAFTASGATLELIGSPTPLVVAGDSDALEQMFVNLLLNAGQALADGGKAQVSALRSNGQVVVSITDTGRGIAREEMTHVLEPFYTTRIGGTGLGLPIARQIARAHGGDLEMSSELGAGTTVRIVLPVSHDAG